ncbi:MAG: hypothetical protein HY646_04090 [Acidobacteria bacterium]|nr:hypothetical protein [Acidobacteriota bacterium]
MSNTIGHSNDLDFKQDLDIVARGLPGKGAALGRMIERAEVTHSAISDHLKCSRSTVSHWIAERKWPKPRRLLDTLIFLQIDRKLLAEASAILMGGEMAVDVFQACGSLNILEVTREQMLELISSKDDFEQRDLIFRTFTPHAYLAMALKASGFKGAESADPKVLKLFFDERRLHEEEARRRNVGSVDRTVTTLQAEWAVGNVCETPEETAKRLAGSRNSTSST